MKKALFIIVGILAFISIPITVYFVGQRQELRKNAAPATTVSFAPAVLSTSVGETFTLSIVVDTGANQVVTANIAVQFDPTKFEAQSITNGPFFPKILTSGAVGSGTASITVSAPSTTQPITGNGVAAILRLKTISEAPSPVSVKFSDSTFIGGIGEQQVNVLVGTAPAIVTITGSSQTASQLSPTVTATPIQTGPTPTPSTAPLIGTSGTPTLTPAQSISVTPTPTTTNASASGTLTVTNPKDGSTVTNTTTFRGKAPPGSTVTIVIHSDPVTTTVTADANGNWIYTPTTNLETGTHTLVASTQNPTTGTVETTSANFTVSDGSTLTPMPTSGTTSPTYVLLILGGIFFGLGFTSSLINKFAHQSEEES